MTLRFGDPGGPADLLEPIATAWSRFLQADVAPGEREPSGLEGVFRVVFPLATPDGRRRVEYLGYQLGAPRQPLSTCRGLGLTWGRPLLVTLRLACEGAPLFDEVLQLAELPELLPGGTVLFEGVERTVPIRLQRVTGASPAAGLAEMRALGPDDLLLAALRKGMARLERTIVERLVVLDEAQLSLPALIEPRDLPRALEAFFRDDDLAPPLGARTPLARLAEVRQVVFASTKGIALVRRKIPETPPEDERGALCPLERPAGDGGPVAGLALGARVEGEALVAGNEPLGVVASLVPFLERDDPNRQARAVLAALASLPLVHAELPAVGSGLEERVTRASGAVVLARVAGTVTHVDEDEVVIDELEAHPLRPGSDVRVALGAIVREGELLAVEPGGPGAGRDVLVAWAALEGVIPGGAVISDDLAQVLAAEQRTTLEALALSRGNVGSGPADPEWAEGVRTAIYSPAGSGIDPARLTVLAPDGVVRNGSAVIPGDLLVGVRVEGQPPRGDPDARLRRDVSLVVPPGGGGRVRSVKRWRRRQPDKREQQAALRTLDSRFGLTREALARQVVAALKALVRGGQARVPEPAQLSAAAAAQWPELLAPGLLAKGKAAKAWTALVRRATARALALEAAHARERDQVQRGDQLPAGVEELVQVELSNQLAVGPGDLLATRHGTVAVVTRVVPAESLPQLADGTPVQLVLHPDDVSPGELREGALGWACQRLKVRATNPALGGANDEQLAGILFAGKKKKAFAPPTEEIAGVESTVGWLHVMRVGPAAVSRLVARATGPYSTLTRCPLGDGQPAPLATLQALLSAGAPRLALELATVKADDPAGRARLRGHIENGRDAPLEPGLPDAFARLIAHLRACALGAELGPDGLELRLASSAAIRSASGGRVFRPERLDPESGRPVPDGLSCEAIFGPATSPRREVAGHVDLPLPALHPWFFDQAALLLGLERARLEKIVYFQAVTPRVLEGEPRDGAAAIQVLLRRVDLSLLAREEGPVGELARGMQDAGILPESLVLEAIPLLPPDLRPRPTSQANGDLDELYGAVISRASRVARRKGGPEVILRNEARLLQESVDALFENERLAKPVLGPDKRPLRSLSSLLEAAFADLLGKPTDFSARAAAAPDPDLGADRCALPEDIAWPLLGPAVMRRLVGGMSRDEAKEELAARTDLARAALAVACEEEPVLLDLGAAGPTALVGALGPGDAVMVPTWVWTALRAGGDPLAVRSPEVVVHAPLSVEARSDAMALVGRAATGGVPFLTATPPATSDDPFAAAHLARHARAHRGKEKRTVFSQLVLPPPEAIVARAMGGEGHAVVAAAAVSGTVDPLTDGAGALAAGRLPPAAWARLGGS